MVTVPLGVGAFKRTFAGEPDVVLQNRFFEKDPSNLVEHSALLARAGSDSLVQLAGGTIRGSYSKLGMFGGDLFTVSGPNLWRVATTTVVSTQITGTITGDGFPYSTWMKGIGYEYLFISDGITAQYFSEHAFGTATLSGNVQEGMILNINGVYYGWYADVEAGSPAGTVGNPWRVLLASGGISTAANNAQSLQYFADAINFAGSPGSYSSGLTGPNAVVTAQADEKHIYFTAIDNTTAGNAITTAVAASGGGAIAFGAGTLSGGGGTALRAVTGMAAGEVAKALATVSGYVLVSVGNSQKVYWINPGETIIDPLNFFEKESNPDNVLDMVTVGDQVLIMGNGSTENWYATGDFNAPFAPVEGRVYQRGVIEGTPTNVGDAVCLVGQDGVVYLIGYPSGGGVGNYGVHRISTNGIEERVRTQIRFEQGLSP
jgi:hypothetical protein